MAKDGKKQGGKTKTTKTKSGAAKNSGAKKSTTAKRIDGVKKPNTSKAAKTTKTTKKPASFSKNATVKKTSKKVIKEKANFAEFETLKLGSTDSKPSSKIIVRDVAKEKPIDFKVEKKVEKKVEAPKPHPVEVSKLSAKEIKEREIEKAIKSATNLPKTENVRRRRSLFGEFGFKRAILVAACATTAIFAVAYFINLASSDISLQAAATQSGIDAKYPSYVPRGYELSDVTSASGKVSMHFKSSDGEFGLSEESSNWDSEALLNNYIKPTYDNDYTVVREQGLTLYMGSDWEAWVNGGMLYKLSINSGTLTKKQMKSIATSL